MKKRKKVFQFNTALFVVSGIQRVISDIHAALHEEYEVKIAGTIPYDKVNPNIGIKKEEYVRFWNPFQFRNSVVIFHERRILPLMWLLSHIPGLGIKSVYVHHNELYGHKKLSLFPKKIVAISDSGINNLVNYFGISSKRITKIHNCVRETAPFSVNEKKYDVNNIKILYPAAVTQVKRQNEIVKHLNGKLDSRITILFAGVGYEEYEKLQNICADKKQFQVLGFRDDIEDLMKKVDFTLLFSTKEGLPISLIESCKSGTPILCNDVGGNCEIVEAGYNGYVVNTWSELINLLNSLPKKSDEEISQMKKNSRKKFEMFSFEKFKRNYIKLIESL